MPGAGIGLFQVACRGGAAFSPLSLFSSGEQGGWYDPSDLSTMFQNDNGTGAVAVNDTVGYIADKSGNGNHLTQSNSARRPALRESGGLYYLEFDGTDDVLFGTLTTQIVAPWDFWLAANITTGGGIGLGLFSKTDDSSSVHSSADTEGVFQRSDGAVRQLWCASRIGSGTSYVATRASAFTINSPFFVRCSAETGPDQLRVTTTSGSDAAAAVYTGTPGNSAYRIGHQDAGCQWRFFNGIAVDRVLSSSEATDLQAYIEAKAGI